MNPIPNNVDWSATAAWIALVISIISSFLGPIITTILTNRYQLKLRKMDLKEKSLSEKRNTIRNCISHIGSCAAFPIQDSISSCGQYFHNVYPYIPQDQWPLLDSFYQSLLENKWDDMKKLCPNVIHLLASILAEEPL